jgi:hypothetical protein
MPFYKNKKFYIGIKIIQMLLFCLIAAPALSFTPPTTNRVGVHFNLGWKYKEGDVAGASLKTFSDASWTSVTIPHSTKWISAEDKTAYIGWCWYRKHFTVDAAQQGKKAFVEFEAAMQYAEVWVNGNYKGFHMGGYAPFTFDITNDLAYGGEDNVIAVRLNTAADARWAPGMPSSKVDFQYFGGLYRDVNLYFTDKLHITDAVFANKAGGGGIFITYPVVSTSSATVSIKTDVINECATAKNCTVVSDIIDAQGTFVQTATTAITLIAAGTSSVLSQSITISNPKLWHPNTPNLYTLHTTVRDGATPVDYYKTRFGIRSIQWTHSNGIMLNGQSYKVNGANMHQDIFGLGNAVSKRTIYYDVKRFKEAGLNFVRGSHYPHNTAFYDACDELGILVENSMTGWQVFFDTDSFKNNTYQEIRDMIRRDRNHPCVAIWETQLNEAAYTPAWAQGANTCAKQEFAGAQMYTCGTGGGMGLYTSVNWDVMVGASQHSIRSANTMQPVIICEYGSWDYGGEASTSDVLREASDAPQLVQCDNIQESLNKNQALSWYSAGAFWVFGDYAGYVTGGYPVNRLSGCGIVDYYRIPKFSYYFFQSQRDPSVIIPGVNSGPMVKIANRWTTGSPSTVRVFSNCSQVSLYRDNVLVATNSPDAGANTSALLHPPFTFSLGSYSSGTLRAVGLIGGVEKAADTVRTPGAAVSVRLRPEGTDTLAVGGSDTRLVWIDIVDNQGTIVYSSTASVALSVTGGSIVGPSTLTMKAGQLATWVRAGTSAGVITITASSQGLTSGSTTLHCGTATGIRAVTKTSMISYPDKPVRYIVCGNQVTLPKGLTRRMSVTVYDLAGKLLHSGIVTEGKFSFGTRQAKTTGIYVVFVRSIR